MKQQALGLIETYGLVAAIEAADVALKTAAVELINYEKVTGGLLTVAVTGEVAAVQAAVAAGSAAAAKVGELVSQHVIPRPLADMELMLSFQGPKESGPDPGRPDDGGADPAGPGDGGAVSEPVIEGGENSSDNSEAEISAAQEVVDEVDGLQVYQKYLESLGVQELRRLARKTEGIAIKGRQISKANKEVLITEILRAKNKKQ